jgi:hypothetical protein
VGEGLPGDCYSGRDACTAQVCLFISWWSAVSWGLPLSCASPRRLANRALPAPRVPRPAPQTEIRPPGHQQRGDLLEGGAHACRCVLCPIKYGAFKRSEDGRHWVHSVSLSGRVGRCWRAVHAALVGPVVAKLVPPRLLRHILSAGSQRTRVVKMHALDYQPQPHTSPSSPPQACALWVPETFLGTREVPGVGRQDYVGGLERVRQER